MNDTTNKLSRALSVAGFSVLAGFFGVGVAWIVIGIWASVFKHQSVFRDMASQIMPFLIGGGVAGFIIGLMVSLRVAKADRETEQKVVAKYVGRRGEMKIYLGFPMLLFVATMPFSQRISHLLGTNHVEYVTLGLLMASVAIGLFLYDRIPRRFIVPVGIISWFLIIIGALAFAVSRL
jgi:hypothetical protein